VSEPEQESQNGGAGTRQDEDGGPSFAEVAAGYITALVVLVYPIGLLTFAAQLWTSYGYAPNTSYFAASLAPTAVGAARVAHSFLWFLVAIVAVITIFRNLEIPRNLRNARSLRGLLAAPREDRPKLKQRWRTITIIVFTALIVPLSSGTSIVISITGPTDLFTQRGLILYGTFVILVGIGGFGGAVWREEITREKGWWTRFVAFVPVYLAAIFAAIVLAGAQGSSLPRVELGREQSREVLLLSHSQGYWYVFDEGRLSAIPDDKTGSVSFPRKQSESLIGL
jgi:hypothetical protein